MAVVEYKHHVYLGDHRRHIPGFISDPDHLYNPDNHSFVGWVKENADYYIPWTTLKILSKEDIVQRFLTISSNNPIRVPDESAPNEILSTRELTSESEIRAYAEKWYDDFVLRNSI